MLRRTRAVVHTLVVLSLLVLGPGGGHLPTAEAQGSGVSYVYDPLGRLVGVLDGSGGIAKYVYDPVGNLTAILRDQTSPPFTPVLVTGFTPTSGSVGTTVTISGAGFSTTPSANTVTFTSATGTVGATVSTATSTQLSVAVPSGAITGFITVSTTTDTSPMTHGTAFTVTGTRVPTISGVSGSPGATVDGNPVVAPSSTVTISGTNFETGSTNLAYAANNVVAVNDHRSQVTAATSTSLTTSLATIATSGRVRVRTPAGSVTWSDHDLFVLPPRPGFPAWQPSDVAHTGRIAPSAGGGTIMWNFPAPGSADKLGLLVFDGTAGHRISLTAYTTGSANVDYRVLTIYQPDGTPLPGGSGRVGRFLAPVTLPVTGTYTIGLSVAHDVTVAETITLTLYDVVDVFQPTIINPPTPVPTVQLLTPGQKAILPFRGDAGRRIQGELSAWQIHSRPDNTGDRLSIRRHDGSELFGQFLGSAPTTTAAVTLPATETYTLEFDPGPENTFDSVTLRVIDAPFATPTNTPTGPSPTRTNTPSPTATNTPSGSATPTFTPTLAPTATPLTGPALAVRPAVVAPGGVSNVDWGGLFPPRTPTTSDWIGLYPNATLGDASPIATVFTTGGVSGEVALPIPTTAPTSSAYETRLFNIAGAATRVAVSNSFSVSIATATPTSSPTGGPSPTATNTPTSGPSPTPSASLSVRPFIIPQGGTVSADWVGIPTPTASDWIGLYVPGALDSPIPTPTVLTTGQSTGQVAFPLSTRQELRSRPAVVVSGSTAAPRRGRIV
jgi:YD repeat-containing protein